MLNVNTLFYLFSIALVISSVMVIIARNPIFSLLTLISSFLSASVLLFILECEFLALIFIIVYVGAIAILFLFAVMMLETKLDNLSQNSMKEIPIGLIFIFGLLLPLLYEISISDFNNTSFHGTFYFNKYINWYDLIDSISDVEMYGQILYSYFVLQFLIVGMILLLVLIGVVYLTNVTVKENMNQSVFKQLSRNSKLFF